MLLLFFLKLEFRLVFPKKNCIETVPYRGYLELCKMKKSSCNRQSGDDDDDDMFLYVAATENLACQSRPMAKEQDTAENCFSGKFNNEVQILHLKTSKNKSVGFAEQHESRPIRGSNAYCHKGVRDIHWELPTLCQ